MNYILRKCTISDVDYIYKLNSKEMGYEYSLEETKNKLSKLLNSDKDKIVVADIDGTVVGYVHATDYNLIYAPHMKNIMGIAVANEYRQKGIGKALLAKIEEWAKETGAEGVRLVSGDKRIDAHNFYQKCGYDKGNQKVSFKKDI